MFFDQTDLENIDMLDIATNSGITFPYIWHLESQKTIILSFISTMR